MSESTPTVLVVEDHNLLAQTLVVALGLVGIDRVEVADDLGVEAVLATAAKLEPDVVLLDLFLGAGASGLPMITPLAASGAKVLVLTGSRDRKLLAQCLEAGATGLFYKGQPFDELVELVQDAALGHTVLEPAARAEVLASLRDETPSEGGVSNRALASLSPREREVLGHMAEGKSAEEIAHEAFVSLATVRSHIRSILRKLGVNSQLAAVVLAQRAGWSTGPS